MVYRKNKEVSNSNKVDKPVKPNKIKKEKKPKKVENTEKKSISNRINIKNKGLLFMTAGLSVCALVVLFFVLNLMEDANTYVVGNSAVQYYADMKIDIPQGNELHRSSEAEINMTGGGADQTMSSVPIYYEGQDKLVLPHDMSYYDPSHNTRYRLDYFTELEISGGAVIATKNGQDVILNEGFLHDGKDFYLLLEPMTLELEGYSVPIKALSYVELVYQQYVMVFDYDNKYFYTEQARGDIIAVPDTQLYEVSLINDTYVTSDGEPSMLITRPEFLNAILD